MPVYDCGDPDCMPCKSAFRTAQVEALRGSTVQGEKPAFTPGPWVRGWNGGKSGPTCPNIEGPTVAGREWRFDLVGVARETLAIIPLPANGSLDEMDANASLIAAAPEMYEALQKAARQFSYYAENHRSKGTPESESKAQTNEAYAAMCRAALSKATGQAPSAAKG